MNDFGTTYLNHPSIGSGTRLVYVLRAGPKWTRLLVFGPLKIITISTEDFCEFRPVPITPCRLKRELKKLLGWYGAHRPAAHVAEIKDVIRSL